MGRISLLTQDVEGKCDPSEPEAFKEAKCAEHGDINRKGHRDAKHECEEHWHHQNPVTPKPDDMESNQWVKTQVSSHTYTHTHTKYTQTHTYINHKLS